MNIGRKLSGCALVKFQDKPTIVVAGGQDSEGNKLSNVEILKLEPIADEDEIKEELKKSKWEELPELNFARSNFPSVGIVQGTLIVTAGKLDDPDSGKSVEEFDGQKWIISQDLSLKSPRFGHSTLKITKDWCDCDE